MYMPGMCVSATAYINEAVYGACSSGSETGLWNQAAFTSNPTVPWTSCASWIIFILFH